MTHCLVVGITNGGGDRRTKSEQFNVKDVIRGGFYDALDWTTSSIIREPGVVILNNDKTVGGECLTRSGTVLEEEREEIKKKKKKKKQQENGCKILKSVG